MNEWLLIGLLLIIAVFATLLLVYPLRANKVASMVLTPIILVGVALGYGVWGGFDEWQQYLHQEAAKVKAQTMLQSIKSPQELIARLKTKLDDSPQSAKGWYLLGRLYSNQGEFKEALNAFTKAHQLQPQDEQFSVNHALALWQMNKQQFTPEIVHTFEQLLAHNPNQPDALSMLAMNAFMNHAYEEAIDYWQRLLRIMPSQSEEASTIRKAIAKAQEYNKIK